MVAKNRKHGITLMESEQIITELQLAAKTWFRQNYPGYEVKPW